MNRRSSPHLLLALLPSVTAACVSASAPLNSLSDAGGRSGDANSLADVAIDRAVASDGSGDGSKDAGADSGCMPGATKSCYSGPPGTEGVGTCVAGKVTCETDGTWGPCIGEIDPEPDLCGGPDSECNGKLPPQQCPGDITSTFADPSANYLGIDPTTGNLIVSGYFGGSSVDFGLGTMTGTNPETGYMLTLDPTLKPIAQLPFGGSNGLQISVDSMGNRFVFDSVYPGWSGNLGGGLIVGGALGQTGMAMYDSAGTFVWQDAFEGDTRSTPYSPAIHDGLSIFLVDGGPLADYGCGAGTPLSNDTAIVVLGTNGTCAWETHLGEHISARNVVAQSDGTLIALGVYDGTAGVSLGTFPLTSGGYQTLLFALDTTGTVTWVDVFQGPGTEFSNSFGLFTAAIGATDEIYVYGSAAAPSINLGGGALTLQSTSSGGNDLVLARFDSTGHYVWAKRLPGDGIGATTGLLAVGSTALFISGSTEAGHVELGGNLLSPAFIGSLDLDGNYRWSVAEYTDTPRQGVVAGTSFLYVVTQGGNIEQILY